MSWSNDEIVAGVANTEVPVSVAQRQWGPTDELFLVYDLKLNSSGDIDHELWLEGFDCGSSTDCDTLTDEWGPDELGSALLVDEQLQPSLALRKDTAGDRYLHAVRRAKVNTDCDNDSTDYDSESSSDPDATRMDLGERIWNTAENGGTGGEEAGRVLFENPTGTCEDNGVNFAKWRDDTAHACWTHKSWSGTPSVEENEVWCDERDTSSQGYWNSSSSRVELDNGVNDATHDHPWFDYEGTGTDRVVAHHEDDSGDAILVRFIDRTGSPEVALDQSGDGEDYPAIDVINDERLVVVYQDEDGTTDEVRLAECDDGSVDCTNASNWTDSSIATGPEIEHVEFKNDGDKQFVLFQKDIDVSGTDRTRAHVMWRCGTNSWNGPDEIDVGTSGSWDHSLDFGRPHLGIDKGDDVLYVALLEVTSGNANLISARAGYTDCSTSTTDF